MGTTLPAPKKKMARNRKRKAVPGFLPNPTRWKLPVPMRPAMRKKRRPRSFGRKHAGKRNSLQEYPEHLFGNNVVKERRQTYVSSENYERVRTLLSVIAPTLSISCYIDNILSAHLEQYRDELNAIYGSRINLKPL